MCDCLVALSRSTDAGDATLFAKNSDRPPEEAQRIEWHRPRNDRGGPLRVTHVTVDGSGRETIGVLGSRPAWMWGFEHGVNEAGVAAGNETIYTTLDPRGFPPALTGMDLVRLALERSASAEDAVAVVTSLLERYGQGGTGHEGRDKPYWSSFLLADATDAWVVETSGRQWEAEQVGSTRAISNRTTIPSFDEAHRHPRQPVETLVDPRWRASRQVLEGHVTVDSLKAHLRSHAGGDDGWTVCMHVDGVEATTAAIVATSPAGVAPVARMLLGSPCTSVFVPLVVGRPVGEPVDAERFLALRRRPPGEVRPALDELERSLDRDVRDDDGWAAEAWQRVDDALRALGA